MKSVRRPGVGKVKSAILFWTVLFLVPWIRIKPNFYCYPKQYKMVIGSWKFYGWAGALLTQNLWTLPRGYNPLAGIMEWICFSISRSQFLREGSNGQWGVHDYLIHVILLYAHTAHLHNIIISPVGNQCTALLCVSCLAQWLRHTPMSGVTQWQH